MLSVMVASTFFLGQVHNPVPKDIMQYRPPNQSNLSAQQLRTEGKNIDAQISSLYAQRDEIRTQADQASGLADEYLEAYHEQIELQQRYHQQMQSIDAEISQLVRQKSDLQNQIQNK
jgi:peptidoglycan hydrolase CwlO-like protein